MRIRVTTLAALAAGWMSWADVSTASVYTDVMAALTNGENRLPGSASFDHGLAAVEARLREAGLDPQIQTFDTLVPRTEFCRLTVGGREVAPVFPLNNGVGPLVTRGAVEGPLLRLGDGSLEAMAGKSIRGSIALIDLSEPHVEIGHAFAEGARAVILVGQGPLSQWTAVGVSQEGPASVPRLYVDGETARRAGLFEAEGRLARIEARVRLADAVGRNLWAAIPGRPGTTYQLGAEEALVLSAEMATAGLVPDRCPDVRRAANVALLAEVACGMARRPPPGRTVVFLFLGNPNSAQEAARYFYYALSHEDRNTYVGTLDDRLRSCQGELEEVNRLLEACGRTDIIGSSDPAGRALALRIKERLVGWVNGANAELSEQRRMRKQIEDGQQRGGATPDGQETPAPQTAESLDRRIAGISESKTLWNALRMQIAKGRGDLSDPSVRKAFDETVASVRQNLNRRREELLRQIASTRSYEPLARIVRDRVIVAHMDFDFANAIDPWFLSMLGDASILKAEDPAIGNFLLPLSAVGKIYRQARNPAWTAPLLDDALAASYEPQSLAVPSRCSVPSTVATGLGIPGFQLMTAGIPLDGDSMPVRESVDLSALVPQMIAVAGALAEDEAMSIRHPFATERMQERLTYVYRGPKDYAGLRCINYSKGSTDMEGPACDAVLAVRDYGMTAQAGLNVWPVARVNAEGYVTMPCLARYNTSSPWRVIPFAIGYDADGRVNRCSLNPAEGISAARLPLFYCYGGSAFSYGYGPEPVASAVIKPSTLDARSDSAPKTLANVPTLHMMAFYSDRPGRIKRIGSNGELLLGATPDAPTGRGIALDADTLLGLDGVRQSANDYWWLNESRLRALRERNIVKDDLETVHSEAKQSIDEAQRAREAKDYAASRAHSIVAISQEARIYGPLRGVAEDLVQAVVFLLVLSLPFAFAMERLVFGFTSVYRQVVGFAGFFVATFGILYVTHPAFALAAAPVIIFLAFVIILLGVVTVHIVLGKIRKEIRMIQGLASKVHGVESDTGTALAAVLLGISGMRNRPLKTFLTAVTVVLLTFTILVFASFSAKLGVVERDLGKGQDENRIELHRFSYMAIHPAFMDTLKPLFERDFHIVRRGVAINTVLYNPATRKTLPLGAAFGLERAEADCAARVDQLLPGFRTNAWPHPPLFLPATIAEQLAVRPGEEIKMTGRSFTYAGPFSSSALQDVLTLDNTRILPPDIDATVQMMATKRSTRSTDQMLEESESGQFSWFTPERVAITELAPLLVAQPVSSRAFVNFLTLYPRSANVDIASAGRRLATVFRGAVHIKSSEGVRRFFFTKAVQGSGFADVVIPLLLGGLIIFSSLMGSIVDREREIFTYSAMGLSPPSVGALFFAESAVYSVVGGMGGYLVSQVVAGVLSFLGSRGILHPPEMNFSSLSSVLTIFVVMAVVMLSTVYPALKAGRSANPGVARKWKMPAAAGDRLNFVFPFTVSEADFAGILSFIKEHFENHGDATLGSFSAREVRLFRTPAREGRKDVFGIAADVSLAPFDLGIFQKFCMYSKEFEIKGIDEVVVEIERVGGTPTSWKRANRHFANELRQQFLLWRSLPIETVQHYRQQTAEALAAVKGESA